MKRQFPIYAKIVGWFFINLLLLGLIAWVLLRKQIGDGSDWLLTPESKTRIRSMLTSLRGELDATSNEKWDAIFKRFSAAYRMQFMLVRNTDASWFAGEKLDLPPEVHRFITARPGGAREGPPPAADPPPFDPLDLDPPGFEPPPRLPERGRPPGLAARGEHTNSELITTENPRRYWLLMRGIPFEMSLGRGPQPTTLVAVTGSLSQSSLLFNPWPWIYAAGGMFIFSVIFWVPLVRSLTRATKQMTDATERIASGDFDVQVNDRRRDELGRLGAAINQMASRLSGFVSGQKRFLGDIAHELCSPLVRMEMALGVLEQRAPEDLSERVADVQNEVREMRELVNELLNFSKAGLQGQDALLEPLELATIVKNVIERDGDGASLRTVVPRDLFVLGSRTLLTRAISNVVRNAIRYAGDAGPIMITARPMHDRVIVTITDEGPGVPSDALPLLFDAFYRPDIARDRETGGFGLGLAIVKTCITACKGTVSARNREGRGLEVRFELLSGN